MPADGRDYDYCGVGSGRSYTRGWSDAQLSLVMDTLANVDQAAGWSTLTTISGAPPPLPSPPLPSPPLGSSLTILMSSGWTWFSLNLETPDMSVGGLLGSLPLEAGDQLKSQSRFTDYYAGFGFFGQLSTLTTDESYTLKLSSAATLSVSGSSVNLPKAAALSTGWTWLPMPYGASTGLATGMPSFGYAASDLIKSQSSFAEFYLGFGWFGTLNSLDPGRGYRVKVSSGGTATFTS